MGLSIKKPIPLVYIALLGAVVVLVIFQNCGMANSNGGSGIENTQGLPVTVTSLSDTYKSFNELVPAVDAGMTQQTFTLDLVSGAATINIQNASTPVCQDAFTLSSTELSAIQQFVAGVQICGGPGSPPRPQPDIACAGGCPQHIVTFFSSDFSSGSEQVYMSIGAPADGYYFCGGDPDLLQQLSVMVQQNSKCTSDLLW